MLHIPVQGETSTEDGAAEMGAASAALPKFGVALFDNPRDMSAGWACRADESPFKFNSVAELDNDTIWVTSLEWNEYQLRAQKLSHLRRVDYLRSSLTSIAADLGRRVSGAYARESSAVLSKVVRNAMMIAIHAYPWNSPTTDLTSDVLSDDIRRILPASRKAPTHLRASLVSALQPYSVPDWAPNFEPDSVTVTIRFNRLEYARKILATLVPDDSWTYISPQQASKIRIEDLLDPSMPSLVEAAVELGDIDPEVSTLIAFGAQAQRRTALRKWISQPELAWLLRYTKVRVSSALLCKSAMPLPAAMQLPEKLFSDPLFSLSISAGLVAESHWYSMVSPVYNRAQKSNEISSTGVWLRAVDRMLSFQLALKAHKAQFRVNSYGNGSIVVRVRRDQLPALLAFAQDNEIAHPAFHPLFVEHGIAHD